VVPGCQLHLSPLPGKEISERQNYAQIELRHREYLFSSIARRVRHFIFAEMTQKLFSTTVEISAPPSRVSSVLNDVERWPEWTPSVSRVVTLSSGPLHVGSRVRVHQPKLPPAWWRVTELSPAGFTWVSVAPGVRVTARHTVTAIPSGSSVTLSICFEGPFGGLLARWTRNLNERYLAMEANGLKVRCTRPEDNHSQTQQYETD
jgi:hypothetical protein